MDIAPRPSQVIHWLQSYGCGPQTDTKELSTTIREKKAVTNFERHVATGKEKQRLLKF